MSSKLVDKDGSPLLVLPKNKEEQQKEFVALRNRMLADYFKEWKIDEKMVHSEAKKLIRWLTEQLILANININMNQQEIRKLKRMDIIL